MSARDLVDAVLVQVDPLLGVTPPRRQYGHRTSSSTTGRTFCRMVCAPAELDSECWQTPSLRVNEGRSGSSGPLRGDSGKLVRIRTRVPVSTSQPRRSYSNPLSDDSKVSPERRRLGLGGSGLGLDDCQNARGKPGLPRALHQSPQGVVDSSGDLMAHRLKLLIADDDPTRLQTWRSRLESVAAVSAQFEIVELEAGDLTSSLDELEERRRAARKELDREEQPVKFDQADLLIVDYDMSDLAARARSPVATSPTSHAVSLTVATSSRSTSLARTRLT